MPHFFVPSKRTEHIEFCKEDLNRNAFAWTKRKGNLFNLVCDLIIQIASGHLTDKYIVAFPNFSYLSPKNGS